MRDPYAVLGVSRTASEADIVHSYRVLIRTWHPDIAGPAGADRTAAINHAYDVLHDPAARRDYDRASATPAQEPTVAEPQRSGDPVPPTAHDTDTVTEPPLRRLIWTLIALATAAVTLLVLGAFLDRSTSDAVARVLLPVPMVLGFLWVLLHRRRKWVGWPWLLLPAIVQTAAWGPGLVQEIPAAALPRLMLLLLACSSVTAAAFLIVLFRAKKRLLAVHDIRAWERLRRVHNETDGSRIYWVAVVNNYDGRCDALLEGLGSDVQESRSLWGACQQGTWILVNSADNIIDCARNEAPAAWAAAAGL